MPTLTITRGLPASGKTTYARDWVAESPDTRARANRDDLRMMLFGQQVCTFQQEEAITELHQQMARALLLRGLDVIADDMNLRPKYVRAWRKFAAAAGAEFVVHEMPTAVLECIKRDAERGWKVGQEVIEELAAKYLKRSTLTGYWFLPVAEDAEPPTPDRYEPRIGSTPAIIVDIDGTVALMGTRGPYDLDSVADDLPNQPVIDAVRAAWHDGLEIVFCSGREDVCRDATLEWIAKHVGVTGELFMRAADDKRRDSIVKRELFDRHIRDRYDIRWVYDDRSQVVEMWRALGLPVFQVAEGNF